MSDIPNVEFDVNLTESSINRLAERLAEVIAGGLDEGFQRAVPGFRRMADTMEDVFGRASDHMAEALEDALGGNAALRQRFIRQQDQLTQAILQTSEAALQLGFQERERITQQIRAKERERALEISSRDALVQTEKQKTAIIESEGKLRAVEAQREGQLQVVAARAAGKQRVLIAQETLRTIGRLERGFAAVVSGVARTTTSAVGSLFSGLGRLVSRSNSQFSEGMTGALRARESAMRRSFGEQERIVRTSVLRQSAQLQDLQQRTQAGLLGFANRRNLFGGLAAAIGAGSLLISTFTIGADFTRGLAVLEAQLGLTKEQMEQVRQTSINLGNDITLPGVSALDAAQAIQLLSKQFAQLGPAAITAAQDASKGTLQLARAAGVGAEEAAQLVGSAVNVFGIAADQATSVADQITAALAQAAGVGFGEFSDAFRQAAAVFAQFQVPAVGAKEALTEFNTALAVIARSGVTGSDAGTSLRQFFLQANRGTDDAVAALAQISERAGVTGSAFFTATGEARALDETLDILRRGLVGLTDEQRSNTLQTIFGSDAIRVANALLNVSTEEYARVTEQVRKEGLAAKIAAAQNQGLKGALDAALSVFQTVQILLFEKVNVQLGHFVLALTEVANTILFDTAPALVALRHGLIGAAAGMAAILAARGAVEVIQLLGTAAKLAFTPFGALIAAAGLAGFAIGVMIERVPELGAAFGELGQRILDLLNLESFDEILARLGVLITNTVLPAFDRAAKFLADNLVPAFDTTVAFIADTAIPAFVEFTTVVIDLAEKGLGTLTRVARSFGEAVLPFLQPTIDGFTELGRAIGAAFSGDFSQLGQGAGAAVSGIAASIGLAFDQLVEVLRPITERVLSFLAGVFSPENLRRLAGGFLDLVEEIGRIIGSVVTSPTFVTALAGIAAAAALIGVRFVEGLARGILSNLDNLGGLIFDGLVTALRLAFANPQAVIAIVAAAFVGQRIFASISGLFSRTGQEASTGFATGFRNGLTSLRGSFTGFFGGLEGASRQFWTRINEQTRREVLQLQRTLRVLGSGATVTAFGGGGTLSLQQARLEAQRFGETLTDAQLRGLLLRDTLQNIGLAAQGVTKIIGGVGAGIGRLLFDSLRVAFNGPRINALGQNLANLVFSPSNLAGFVKAGETTGVRWRDGFANAVRASAASFRSLAETGIRQFREAAEKQGLTAGQAFGRTFGNAALIGISAFIGGKAAGASGGSALFAAITSGLTGFAIGGPLVGAASAGLSLIGSAFGSAGAAAKKAKEEFQNFVNSLRGELIPALQDGTIALGNFGQVDLPTITSLSSLKDQFFVALGEDGKDAFDKAGLSWEQNIVPILESGGDFTRLGDQLTNTFLRSTFASNEFTTRFGEDANRIADIITDIVASGGRATLSASQLSDPLISQNAAFINNIIDSYGDVLRFVGQTQGALDDINRDIRIGAITLSEPVDGATKSLSEMMEQGFDTKEIIDELFDPGAFVVEDAAVQRGAELAAETTRLLEQAARDAKAATDDLFRAPGSTDFQDALDNLLISGQSVGNVLATAFRDGGPTQDAKVRQALNSLSDEFGEAIRQGVAGGIIIDRTSAENALVPIKDAIIATLDPKDPNFQAQVDAINLAFLGALNGVQPTLDQIKAAEEAAAFAKSVQDFLDTHPGTLPIQAEIIVKRQNLIGSLSSSPVGQQAINSPGFAQTISELFPLPTAAEVAAEAQALGQNVPTGFADGIADPTAGAAVDQASLDLANRAIGVAGGRLQVSSPSRVFFNIGLNVAIGMQAGILAGRSRVINAAIQLAQAAITAANVTLGINSPSKAFMAVGASVSEGFAAGIQSNMSLVHGAIDEMTAVDPRFGLPTAQLPTGTSALGGSVAGSGLSETEIIALGRAIAADVKPDVNIDMPVHEHADPHAVASAVAWRLT